MDWQALSGVLERAYSNPRHGNPQEPVDCLFYLMLSRKTPIEVAGRTLKKLRSISGPDWDLLPDMSTNEIAAALYGSGLEEIRAQHIRKVAVQLRDRFGSVTLEPLRSWSDAECTTFLTELPGVGTKTALCVEMYTLDRQVFPADAHCIRVLKRLGVVPPHMQHRPAQRLLVNVVPAELSYKLHVNLVAHGQQVCRAGQPRCDQCVVRGFCRPPIENAEAAAEVPHGYATSTRK